MVMEQTASAREHGLSAEGPANMPVGPEPIVHDASESAQGGPGDNASSVPNAPPLIASQPRDDRAVFFDDRDDPADRIAALSRLIESPRQDEAISDVLDQFGRADAQPEWRDALVLAAEDIHFPPHLRVTAASRLLSIASTLRSEPEGREKVVWSALRRGASLLAPQSAGRIIPFLENGPVDTRALALQSIARMFEPRPPEEIPAKLADRVFSFASKFLDPDVFTPGEPSLIARSAVTALAAIADHRLHSTLESVRALNRAFLTRRIRQELERLRSGWLARGVLLDHAALKNIDDGLALLNHADRTEPAHAGS